MSQADWAVGMWAKAGYTPRHAWPSLEVGYEPVPVGEVVGLEAEFNYWCPFRRRYMGWADAHEHVGQKVKAVGPFFRKPV